MKINLLLTGELVGVKETIAQKMEKWSSYEIRITQDYLVNIVNPGYIHVLATYNKLP